MIMTKIGAAAVLCLGLAACAGANNPAPMPMDRSITSSNGGGQRALGNIPSVGITTAPAPVAH
jgi:hypothetical protein